MKHIYLDHAATTYVDERVLKKMLPYFTDKFGNSNSQHYFGREGAEAVDVARKQVATAIGAQSNEIYFTAGGSEADNWALKGTAYALRSKGNHIITTEIEHAAIHGTAEQLKKEGFDVTYIGVDDKGFIKLDDLKAAITDKTILISVMMANNEIGTLQPISEVVKIAKEKKILVHTDAVQAVGSVPIDVKALGVDMLSMAGHKFYGPKGIGALYIKNGVKIGKLVHGGEQERSQRGGTSNTPAIVGMGEAIELATNEMEERNAHVLALREHFVDEVIKNIPFIRFNGDRTNRLPNNANFSFEYIEGESILFSLDLVGICASSGSACSSGSLEPSRTLLAIGVPVEVAHGSIRFTFGKDNTMQDVDYTVSKLIEVVDRLRNMSPLFSIIKEKNKNV